MMSVYGFCTTLFIYELWVVNLALLSIASGAALIQLPSHDLTKPLNTSSPSLL